MHCRHMLYCFSCGLSATCLSSIKVINNYCQRHKTALLPQTERLLIGLYANVTYTIGLEISDGNWSANAATYQSPSSPCRIMRSSASFVINWTFRMTSARIAVTYGERTKKHTKSSPINCFQKLHKYTSK